MTERSLAMSRISQQQTRHLMRTDPESVLFPIIGMREQFGFEPEALRQELESGRLKAVYAGIEREPCISGQAFKDWLRDGQTPGVLKRHVIAHLMAKGRPN